MGISVDMVRQGAGNSNDGNTSRRFFSEPLLSAQITQIDEELIERFSTILVVINCNYEIDIPKFEKFRRETAELYVKLCPWYPMNNTVHKILVHGAQIISRVSQSPGSLSEEAQEAINKTIRYFRQHHTRKCSREATNGDLVYRMLARSCPRLHDFIRPPPIVSVEINEKAAGLLKNYPASTCEPHPPSE